MKKIFAGGLRSVSDEGAAVRISQAAFPAPFAQVLEFNAPVHETWNIVHIGMLVPECHQIYVCADNCMRGVVLTAAEMDAADRFSCVLLEEEDLYEGSLENITVEGVTDAISRLPYRPRAVAVFLVCLHHFLGTDASWVYRNLEERFPDIDFMRCWMDPVMQKNGLTPEQKLKESMFRPVRPLPVDPKLVCVLGDNQPVDPDSDLAEIIRQEGFQLFCLHKCKTYDEYLRIGAASLLITRSPTGVHGIKQLAKRLGRPFLYLPPAVGPEEIRCQMNELKKALRGASAAENSEKEMDASTAPRTGQTTPSTDMQTGQNTFFAASQTEQSTPAAAPRTGRNIPAALDNGPGEWQASWEKALLHARDLIGDTEITIDYIASARPLGLARLLLEHDFRVTRVYLDAVSTEEKEDFDWLVIHCPDLILNSTVHPKMRILHERENEGRMLAIGPKAAWFGGTSHFVNIVEYGGMWGFSGIQKLAELMEDAFLHEKDTRSIVPRKGLGCACVL